MVRRSKEKNFVIFSDSMSSLQSINGFNLDSDLVQKFLEDYTVLAKNGKNIILCWIPSHVEILGDEKADAAAKSALSLPVTRMELPATGMYLCITKLIFDEWQEVWNCCAGNKLHVIRPTVGYYKQKTCLLLNRLRIGHTRLTHSFLLSGRLQSCRQTGVILICPSVWVQHVIRRFMYLMTKMNKYQRIYIYQFRRTATNSYNSVLSCSAGPRPTFG